MTRLLILGEGANASGSRRAGTRRSPTPPPLSQSHQLSSVSSTRQFIDLPRLPAQPAQTLRAVTMSSVAADSDAGDAITPSARRKSGRVTKKPEKFAPAAAKRKRGDDHDSGVDAEEASSDEDDESTEGEPDEEELRERRRKSKGKAPAKRSAPKKARTNGKSVTLAMRPAGGASKRPSRPRKAPVRKSILAGNETTGLYGKQSPA